MQMKLVLPASLLFIRLAVGAAEAADNPLAGVITLLNGLTAKVEADAAAEAKAYNEYYDWCNTVTGEKLHAIKLNTERKEKLKADIEKYFAEIEQSGEAISDEAKAIALAIEEGRSAKDLREKQHADFMTAEKDLVDSIDMLSRAITVLQKEMQKGSAAFAQIANTKVTEVVQAIGIVADAAAFSASDRSKLLELVQAEQSEGDDLAAPASDVYSRKSGGIIPLLEDMKDKTETQLSDIRKGEQQARYVFNQLVAALKAQQAADEKDKANEEAEKAEAQQDEAETTQDLAGTRKVLDVHSEAYRKTKAQCMQTASDHEAGVKSRTEELKVLAEVTKMLQDTTAGAVSRRYSFLQEQSLQQVRLHSTSDLVHMEVITLVNHMAKAHHSAALAQLASRISAVMQYGAATGEDIFTKVKGLIKDLIAKLEKKAQEDATEKAYCDEQLAATSTKESDLEDALKKLKAQLDRKTAKFADVKDDVAEMQAELAQMAKDQAKLDKVREDEHAAFVAEKADLDQGIQGLREAMGLLRDYYSEKDEGAAVEGALLQSMQPTPPDVSHKKQGGSASIIATLEMVESDFAAGLAKAQTQESDSQNAYDEETKENEVEKTTLEGQVKFKNKEYKVLDKTISQLSSDRDSLMTEQTAVLEFSAKLKDRCIAEPETYAEIKRRRDAEITGLKEALEILKSDAALMQRRYRSSRLRGQTF